ncbi:Crossover junction endonuclease mus81 [Trichinella spiralis]|uniref:Crossover junction endonuclease mus81 n=1 Tax=Trichinella spiralis TaxID=6334 RepID=A0ABR3K757_TRISP
MQLCNQMNPLLFFLYSYLICKFLHNYKVNILSGNQLSICKQFKEWCKEKVPKRTARSKSQTAQSRTIEDKRYDQ